MPPPSPRKSSQLEQKPSTDFSTTTKRKPAPLGPSSGAKRQQTAQRSPGSGPSLSSGRRQIDSSSRIADLEDDDIHGAIAGDILIASQQLQELSQDHHNGIGNRVASSPTTEIAVEAAKHLIETPPESPSSVESPKLSSTSKKRQTELAGLDLRTLLKNDKALHKQIKELVRTYYLSSTVLVTLFSRCSLRSVC